MIKEIIDGKYEILERLGSGGTSIVYKASRLYDGQIVAVKVIREELEDLKEQERRFRQEVNALSKMSHRNIRKILSAGDWNGSLYMVTEYIDGDTLKDLIASGPLPMKQALDYALQISAGIEHAHLKQIIHRDIKSQNILVDMEGTVKIVDFGIARVLTNTTRTMGGKDVIGSVHYISPEQAKGAEIDARADIYSFGVLMYEMFTGRLPFDGDEAVTVAMKHVNQVPEPPMAVNPELPRGINDIILKCMEKEPGNRYQTASELREDLMLYIANPNGFRIVAPVRKSTNVHVTEEEDPESRSTRTKNNDYQQKVRVRRNKKIAYVNKEEQQKASAARRRRFWVIMLAVLLSLALIALTVRLLQPLLANPTSEYISKDIPKVTDLTKSAATAVLKNSSFSKLVFREEYSNTVSEGNVIRTEPDAGNIVMVNSEITVVISKGARLVAAENVIGMKTEEAAEILTNQGFRVKTLNVEDPEKENGIVVEQSSYNQLIPEGSTITLTQVHNIKAVKRIVPNLSGLNTEEAKQMIVGAGFSVGKYTEQKTDKPDELGVCWQNYPADTEFIHIEGEEPPRVEIEFTVNISSGYKCLYEYTVPGATQKSFELLVFDANEVQIDYVEFNNVSYVSYSFSSENEQTLIFELYYNGTRVDKKTMTTALPSVSAEE